MSPGRCCLTSAVRLVADVSKQYCIRPRASASVSQVPNFRSDLVSRLFSVSAMATSSSSKESDSSVPNKLALEKSPYLLQHANNPVQWYPWGDEALEKAKREDKLIFLSVGYSTCHWCHVMEKESFENSEIAQVMNRYFVNIKVDREERPDIDRIYMTFIQTITGHGGWPMSVFLTPSLTPVTGGTYFPPEDKFGQPGFKRVLLKIAHEWLEHKRDIMESSSKMFKMLKFSTESSRSKKQEIPPVEIANSCVESLSQEFDEEFGGFSPAPKFPQPVKLNLLFMMYARNPNSESGSKCLHMCTYTLQKMAQGGIHDHVGQGFARYSVDGKWHVPHFEKMLYDQGQLLRSYTDAYLATKESCYAEIIDDIVTYVTRDLRHQEGGFYSAEDADSYPTHESTEKKEGAFYVWTYAEIESLLNKEIANEKRLSEVFCHHYCVKPEGNVRKYQDPHGELTNQNVLIVYGTLEETAEHFGFTVESTKAYLKEALEILYKAREKRPRPHLDDKIVTAWNGLMISGLAYAGSALENKTYIDYAESAAKFVEKHLFDDKKKVLLRSCYRDGDKITQTSVPIKGFHSDYAFLIKGLIDLYQATFDPHWIEFAKKLQLIQDKLFWDNDNGGYYLSSMDDSSVILRVKDDQDGAEPSSNAVACKNLLVLSSFLTSSEYKEKAEKLICAQKELANYPIIFPEFLCALLHYHDSGIQIYIAGNRDSEDTKALLRVAQQTLHSGKIIILADQQSENSILYDKNQVISKMKLIKGRAAAYVCRHRVCSLPVTEPEQLVALLGPTDK